MKKQFGKSYVQVGAGFVDENEPAETGESIVGTSSVCSSETERSSDIWILSWQALKIYALLPNFMQVYRHLQSYTSFFIIGANKCRLPFFATSKEAKNFHRHFSLKIRTKCYYSIILGTKHKHLLYTKRLFLGWELAPSQDAESRNRRNTFLPDSECELTSGRYYSFESIWGLWERSSFLIKFKIKFSNTLFT